MITVLIADDPRRPTPTGSTWKPGIPSSKEENFKYLRKNISPCYDRKPLRKILPTKGFKKR